MPDTIRQQIVDAIETALQGIAVDDGYQTDLGANVFTWRSAPFSPAELPAAILRDLDEPIERSTRFSQRHERQLHIQVEIVAKGDESAEDFRKMLADVEQAIRGCKLVGDDTWFDRGDGWGLAHDVTPRLSRMVTEQESYKLAGGFFECFVHYISREFDSYEQ